MFGVKNLVLTKYFLKKQAAKILDLKLFLFAKERRIFAAKKSRIIASFLAFSQLNFAIAQTAPNALPTGGNVVAGSATISQSQTANSAQMNINQTSQRAVISWDSFNVGKNASVNFNQPNSSAVTLNRVTGVSQSMIDGAVRANGQVVLVNPNGVTVSKGAEINAAGVVATTMDIASQDFMDGKSTYKGNGKGAVVNEGKISANDPNGYVALLAPEIRNEGYVLARKGVNSAVALAAGQQITLDFRGDQLISVNVDKATYGALIENKRVVEVKGGLIVVAAGSANQLMGSVIKNTGRISASTAVNNGGVIELVASNVTQAGTVAANGKGANSKGGQVNIVGEDITLAANSKTTATGKAGGGNVEVGLGRTQATNVNQAPVQALVQAAAPIATSTTVDQRQASVKQVAAVASETKQLAKTVTVAANATINTSATQNGDAGNIVIWSEVKTTVNGILKAVGGALGGNGGFIETSSKGSVNLGKQLVVDTSAAKGKSGLWFLDPIDLIIDADAANVIATALANNNVTIAVNGNVCPSLGSCTQNGSGSLTIASGANILKQGITQTTLRLNSSGIFNLNANISGENLNVIISSSIAYLNVGTSINATQVTVQAQTIYANGVINTASSTTLGSVIQLLAQAIYITGGLNVGTSPYTSSSNTNSNTITYSGNVIRKEDLPAFLTAQNGATTALDQSYSSTAANDSSADRINTQSNVINLNAFREITLHNTAELKANGTTGGYINLTAQAFNAESGSLIQANGNNGPGGVIALTTSDAYLSEAISANGASGGSFALSAKTAQFDGNATIQTNGSNGPGGTVYIDVSQEIAIVNSGLYASGSTDGGTIRILSRGGNLNLFDSEIQTNGGNGRGGSIGISAFNQTILGNTSIQANGFIQGGTILIGNDASNGTLPFSIYTSIDQKSSLNTLALDPSGKGGLIETSGQTISLLASINAGRGSMWLLDPYAYTIGDTEASYINNALNNGYNVTITTASSGSNLHYVWIWGGPGADEISVNSAINGSGGSGTLTLISSNILINANITTSGVQSYFGAVKLGSDVVLTNSGAYIYFSSTVDSSSSTGRSLVINNGTSQSIFGGSVGATNPLSSLSVSGDAILFANVATNSSSGQSYGKDLFVIGSVALTSANNPISIAGNINASSAVLQLLGSGNYRYTVGSYADISTAYVPWITLPGFGKISYSSNAYSLIPISASTIDYLVVAGGGGSLNASYLSSGGGGGGGVLSGSITTDSSVTYTASVGAGGWGAGRVYHDPTRGAILVLRIKQPIQSLHWHTVAVQAMDIK